MSMFEAHVQLENGDWLVVDLPARSLDEAYYIVRLGGFKDFYVTEVE